MLGFLHLFACDRDGELLLEMIELRQALQRERLQQMRERIQGTMRQIEGCISELNRLDDGAKV